jgi:hypothetical protein
MAKQKGASSGEGKLDKKARVKWIFPRYTLEQALKLASAIKDLHGGNPWDPDELRKAIGSGVGGNAYFYLTAASRDYGLTTGATARPQVGAVSESCFANDPISRQFPLRSSKNHSRLSGCRVTQSSK